MAVRNRAVIRCGLALIALAGLAIPLTGTASGGGIVDDVLELASSGFDAERIKTVPIAKEAGAKPRVAMTLPPRKLGRIRPGSTVWAGGEVEVSTTCLERMPKCVGTIYSYNPKIRARLVLATGPKATGKARMWPISRWVRQRCSQNLPNRNHHCVIAVDGQRRVAQAKLPCSRCHVNLVVEAYHGSARDGNVVVVGSDHDSGIRQGKGMVNAGIFPAGSAAASQITTARRPIRKSLPVGQPYKDGPKKVIYSRRLAGLRAGEKLIVAAKMVERIGHLPYDVLIQSQLVLSEKRHSVSGRGVPNKIASPKGRFTAQNGFNCTQKRSGHSDPCTVRKIGVVSLRRDALAQPGRGRGKAVPLFVNFVVQNRAILNGRRVGYRSRHAARIARKAGFIRVRRYSP